MDVEQLREDVRAGRITPDRLIDLIVALQRRIEELERQLGSGSSSKIPEPFSVEAEERRQEARDKVCLLMNFFQHLKLRKSQANALLNQLARQWQEEFDLLCLLLANSLVVHTDETGWSINSVWAFLSEKVRVLFFGVHKDAETLRQILDPATFAGLVISDDAAVYAELHSRRNAGRRIPAKADQADVAEPSNAVYRQFTDRLLEIYREACRVQRDRRLYEREGDARARWRRWTTRFLTCAFQCG